MHKKDLHAQSDSTQASVAAARAIITRKNKLLVMHRNKFGKQYYALLGGGIEPGETPQQALVREIKEESGLNVTDYRLVFTEPPAPPYGAQYIYLCTDPGDTVRLGVNTIEAKLNQQGLNLFEPQWLPISELPKVTFMSPRLKRALLIALTDGFPDTPQQLAD